jgi:hypothetical protein
VRQYKIALNLALFNQIFEALREPKICRFALFFGLALVNLKVDWAAYPSRGCQVTWTFLGKMPYSIIYTWPQMPSLSSRVERVFSASNKLISRLLSLSFEESFPRDLIYQYHLHYYINLLVQYKEFNATASQKEIQY